MNLPGERASYGGQDMRPPDERWQLRRGQTYWVRIGKLRKRPASRRRRRAHRAGPREVMSLSAHDSESRALLQKRLLLYTRIMVPIYSLMDLAVFVLYRLFPMVEPHEAGTRSRSGT